MSDPVSNKHNAEDQRDRNRTHYLDSRGVGNSNRYSGSTNGSRDSLLTAKEHELVVQGRSELFRKRKDFSTIPMSNDKFLLSRENLFKVDRWTIEELNGQKQKLNDTRNRLNEKDIKVWKEHTRTTNMTGKIVWPLRNWHDIEMCTNAWIKMAEIFSNYEALIAKEVYQRRHFNTVHLCEAPGAFICATNFYYNRFLEKRGLKISERPWRWTGLSLNPYYEGNDQAAMVDDDRFIIETLDRWYFGVDNSGNILEPNNIKGLWERVKNGSSLYGVDLVTADGSVDTSADPNEQESIVSELHYAEAICALGVLAKGGSFVLKLFNLFECETICLIYILALHFEKISIFKPASSRAPNGETYLIGLGFRGINARVLDALLSFVSPQFPSEKALLSRDSIPNAFIDELVKISEYFTIQQIQAITRNLDLEKIWNRNIQQAVFKLNQDVVHEFRRRCFIDNNYRQSVRIATRVHLDGSGKQLGNSAAVVKGGLSQRQGGTLNDRQNRKWSRDEFLSEGNNSGERTNNDMKDSPPAKRIHLEFRAETNLTYSAPTATESTDFHVRHENAEASKGMKMLQKLGYVEGQGLGIHGQGRINPVETSIRNTRLGLGHYDQLSMNSTSSRDMPVVVDEPLFTDFDKSISANSSSPLSNIHTLTTGRNLRSILSSIFVKFEDLEALYKKREEYILTETGYYRTRPNIFIYDQLEKLNVFEKHGKEEKIYHHFETAFQLTLLDKIFKLTAMNSIDSCPLSFIIYNESLIGFAEYLDRQASKLVKGVIISNSLKQTDFKNDIIYKHNIDTNDSKVHLFFSDLSIRPNEAKINMRYTEQHTKLSLINSCFYALTKLNVGGHFVCKMLDTLTRFTAGIIYILYRSFKSITIIQPFTLDPASPERFLVCNELMHPADESIIQHLKHLSEHHKIDDILEVVPFDKLIEPQFQEYLANVSRRLLRREIQALNKRLWYLTNEIRTDATIDEETWNQAREWVMVNCFSETIMDDSHSPH